MSPPRPLLAFDYGSPVASAAVADSGATLAVLERPRDEGEPDLLRLVAAALAEAGVQPPTLLGAIALAGPGSFTGVRVACAAAQALGQAWRIPVGGMSTLAALAATAPPAATEIAAVVDALRGEWFVQRFGDADAHGLRHPLDEPSLWRPGDPPPAAGVAVGFGAARFAVASGFPGPPHEASGLASAAARAASSPAWSWDASLLTRPLHLRQPATTRPRR